MGYSIGFSNGRDIGYSVPATCDQPGCDEEIDRGMAYCCGEMRIDNACGLYFCGKHRYFGEEAELCDRCLHNEGLGDDAPADKYLPSYEPKPDHPDWVYWKLHESSWEIWRDKHQDKVAEMKQRLQQMAYEPSERIKEAMEWADAI